MKDPDFYQAKMLKWLQRAQEAVTRSDAKKCVKKFSKHQKRYTKAYNQDINQDTA